MKIILGLIFTVLVLFAKENLSKISLQLQWLEQFQFAGYFIAKQKGFYKEVGLEVKIDKFSSDIKPIKRVLLGDADYAIGRSSLLLDIASDKNIVLLKSIFQLSPLILLTTKKHGIKTLHDIKNRRLMNVDDVAYSIAFRSMLSANSIDYEIDIIKLPHSFDVKDLIDNKTDLMVAYISNEPYELKSLGATPVYFSPADYGLEFYDDILFTSEDELINHPKRVKKFVDATLRGWEWAFSHIELSAKIIYEKYNPQKKSLEALIYEGRDLKKFAYHADIPLGDIDIEKLKKIYDIYKSMGLSNKKLDFQSFVYQDLVFTRQVERFFKYHIDNGNFFRALILFAVFIVISFSLNIVLNRRVEKELEKRIEQERFIFRQNRLISMGEMMTNIAHQWRQPLSNINSIVLNIDKATKENNIQTIDAKLSQIEDITAYMSQTIDDFSSYLSPEGEKKFFYIEDVVKIAIKLTQPSFKKNGIHIRYKGGKKIPFTGYKNELIQVLVTILNNAQEALPDIKAPKVEILSKVKNKKIHIVIKDNGKGIEDKYLDKIFDPYFTTKHKRQGTGLGLYISKMIITQKFDGYIDVYIKNGTVFEVVLDANT